MRSLALVLALLGVPAAAQPANPEVRIDSGAIRGTAADGVRTYKGIPFAAPPVGELRWRAPRLPAPWNGTRDASAFGTICPQTDFPGGQGINGVARSEDCLFLNIWAPEARRGKAKLPVLVSIHGGGMVNGSGSDPVFDGRSLARRGLVVVTFNYRLGRLGFFRHPSLEAGAAADGMDGNFALMDQIAALEWVKRNIARFGGDPARVTIAGESAGGVSVLAMMTSPKAKGLFSAAIVQSAVPRFDFASADVALEAGTAFGRAAGANDAAALRALPIETLLKGVEFFAQDKKTFSGAMVDGVVVTRSLIPAFKAGDQAKVPLLIGATGRELGGLPSFAVAAMFGQLPATEQALARSLYDPDGTGGAAAGADYLGDRAFVEPARAIASLGVAAGQPVWTYRFDHVAEHLRPTTRGATHASDVPYSFATLGAVDDKASAADLAAADRVADYWANFVKRHDPNGPGLADWPFTDARGEPLLLIDNEAITVGADPRAAKLNALAAAAEAQP